MKVVRPWRDVAIVAPTSFGYAKTSAHGVPWFVAGTLRHMLETAGLEKKELDGLAIASYRLAPDHGASMSEHLGISPTFLADLPYGGASGVIAVRRAARAVQAGDAELVACIGADVVPAPGDTGVNFSTFSRDHVYPYGAGGPNAVFSLISESYAAQHGVPREAFGALCVAQRFNARGNHHALLRDPMDIADYLAARPITDAFGLYDCVMRCCGAEGVLLMSVARAESMGLPYAVMTGSIERHHVNPADPVQRSIWPAEDCRALYAMAGRSPAQMRFVQAYDDYPVIVLLQLEGLGFCAAGEAARFLAGRDMRFCGDFPLNTSGGMLSVGQAGAAGGFLGLVEAVRQVTGQAGARAVRDAGVGLVSGYGTVNYDRGLCAAAAIIETGRRAAGTGVQALP